MKLQGKNIYLSVLERADCKKLWNDQEYDFAQPTEELNIGHSEEKADAWFDEIQKLQGIQHVRLGIFENDGTVIGDVALQNIDRKNRKCSIGIGIAKIENRAKGYGCEAVQLIIDYGFRYLGMERITANTLEINLGAQKVMERCGLTLEGRERKAVYLNGKKYDRLCYGILKEEYLGEGYGICRAIHAEMNALLNCSRQQTIGADLYLVGINPKDNSIHEAKPCPLCARIIIQAGINNVYLRVGEGAENYVVVPARELAWVQQPEE